MTSAQKGPDHSIKQLRWEKNEYKWAFVWATGLCNKVEVEFLRDLCCILLSIGAPEITSWPLMIWYNMDSLLKELTPLFQSRYVAGSNWSVIISIPVPIVEALRANFCMRSKVFIKPR